MSKTQMDDVVATGAYKYGFETEIESDIVPPGHSEDVIRFISAKKGEPDSGTV